MDGFRIVCKSKNFKKEFELISIVIDIKEKQENKSATASPVTQ